MSYSYFAHMLGKLVSQLPSNQVEPLSPLHLESLPKIFHDVSCNRNGPLTFGQLNQLQADLYLSIIWREGQKCLNCCDGDEHEAVIGVINLTNYFIY